MIWVWCSYNEQTVNKLLPGKAAELCLANNSNSYKYMSTIIASTALQPHDRKSNTSPRYEPRLLFLSRGVGKVLL